MDDGFSARAAARKDWPVRKLTLANTGADDDLSASTTPEQRLGMMWELALGAWSLSGKPLPSYTRAQMPGACVRKDSK